MSYRQAFTELEGQFTTVVGATSSGNTASFGANEIGITELANNAASGLIVSQEFPTLMTGSPSTFGQFTQFGNGTTAASSGLWVVFGRAFKAAPASLITSSRVASIVISHGSIGAGSFFAIGEGGARAFDWIACGSGK